VEGTIDPKGNRLTIGPNGRVKANINACAVIVQGKLEGNIQASHRVDLKQSAVVMGGCTEGEMGKVEEVPEEGLAPASLRRKTIHLFFESPANRGSSFPHTSA
jgi:hypothetical protein